MIAALQQIPASVQRALTDQVSRALAEAIALAPFAELKGVADETLKLAARDPAGRALGIVLCSPEIAPGLIARGCERGRAARAALGSELGQTVVVARAEGECEARSWACFPQARALGAGLAGRLERRWLAGAVLAWLRAAAAQTAAPADDATRARYEAALACAEREPALAPRVREAAGAARERLAAGAWRPRHVLMHGDLWDGNVLGAPGSLPFSRRFVLIDWDTSRVAGYPFFDLLRAANAFRISRARLGREIAAHAALLGCTREDARGALVAALGQIGLVRENFPLARYAEMCGAALAAFDESA